MKVLAVPILCMRPGGRRDALGSIIIKELVVLTLYADYLRSVVIYVQQLGTLWKIVSLRALKRTLDLF